MITENIPDVKIDMLNKIYGSPENWPKKLVSKISRCYKLPIEIIKVCHDKINWDYVARHYALDETFIREFKDELPWALISEGQHLSEAFIREFQDKVIWADVSGNQTLSEDFIKEFQDKVDWLMISMYQNLSESFIREFQDKVDWTSIMYYQKLSDDFLIENNHRTETITRVVLNTIPFGYKMIKRIFKDEYDKIDFINGDYATWNEVLAWFKIKDVSKIISFYHDKNLL